MLIQDFPRSRLYRFIADLSLVRAPRRDVTFSDQSVFADTGVIKVSLLKCVDLIDPGCNMDLDVSVCNGNMTATVFVHPDTETSTDILNDCLAYFYFKLASSIFLDVKIDISLEQFDLQWSTVLTPAR